MDIAKLVALKDKLRADGNEPAADMIARAVGEDGQGGIAKSLTEFFQANPEELGELEMPVKLKDFRIALEPKFPDAEPGTPEATETVQVVKGTLSTDFGKGLGPAIGKAIVVGIASTGLLALPR